MKFSKILINGFKNISEVNIDLEQLTALIAINNYGKSNIMQAIDFGFLFLQSGIQNRQRMMRYQGTPQNESFFNKPYKFVIEGDYDNRVYIKFRYGFGFDWNTKKITFEKLEFLNEGSKNQYKTVFERKDSNNKYSYSSRIDNNNKKTTQIDHYELLVDKIREDEVDYYDVIKYIKTSKYRYCKQIDVTEGYSIPIIISDEDFFISTPKKLAVLHEEKPEKYMEFLFVLKQLFPNIIDIIITKVPLSIDAVTKQQLKRLSENIANVENIKTSIEDSQYIMRIKVDKLLNLLDINQMSNGFKRIVWLLLNILEAEDNNVKILAIEELETGIHQKLLRNLLDKIYEWINKDLILLVSTHSAELVSYLKRDQLVVGVPNENMEAKFIQLSDKIYKKISRDAQLNRIDKASYIFELINNCEDSTSLLQYLGVK